MSKKAYTGDGSARQVKKIYAAVDGKARKVKKGYVGVDGKARIFYQCSTPPDATSMAISSPSELLVNNTGTVQIYGAVSTDGDPIWYRATVSGQITLSKTNAIIENESLTVTAMSSAGTGTIVAVAYNEEGLVSESKSVSVKVTAPKPAENWNFGIGSATVTCLGGTYRIYDNWGNSRTGVLGAGAGINVQIYQVQQNVWREYCGALGFDAYVPTNPGNWVRVTRIAD